MSACCLSSSLPISVQTRKRHDFPLSIFCLAIPPDIAAQQLAREAGATDASFKKTKMTLFEDGKKAKDVQVELAFVGKNRLLVRKAGATLVEIPYSAIDRITYEYNQRRRIAEGAVVMVASLGAGAIVMLTKTKSHWLAVEYQQENSPKTLVVRLDKKEYEAALAAAESETGKKVEKIANKAGIANPTRGSKDLEETVAYPMEKVTAALKQAMDEHNCFSSAEKPGLVECKRPHQDSASGFGGEKLKVKLRAKGSQTRIKIETDKGFRGRAYQKNWSKPVFDSMMKRLVSEKTSQ